jgi:DNA (cytosine-5)-methyltransferase 1
MYVGSLFAGIGGFDLGLERAGFTTRWQVEQDPYRRAVLAARFPDAVRHADVCAVGAADLAPVDLICGGFPCQDLSFAGLGAGLDGERSGLWSEFARIIRELGPRYVLVENVPALLSRGFGRVLADLAACGYDAEWDCVPAAAVGAPHRRDRLWVVAYPRGEQHQSGGPAHGRPTASELLGRPVADAARDAEGGAGAPAGTERQRTRPGRQPADADADARRLEVDAQLDVQAQEGNGRALGRDADRLHNQVADADGQRREGTGAARSTIDERRQPLDARRTDVGDTDEKRRPRRAGNVWSRWWREPSDPSWWLAEPDVGRVADGVPSRVDRLAALGDALVPQVAEAIGLRIIEYEENLR